MLLYIYLLNITPYCVLFKNWIYFKPQFYKKLSKKKGNNLLSIILSILLVKSIKNDLFSIFSIITI